MVALFVLGTIIACLLVDGILLSYRERKTAGAESMSPSLTPELVFAQDGGEKLKEKKDDKPEEVKWEGLQSQLSNHEDKTEE